MNAHDFLRYALLLRAMRDRFEQEDGILWFDDALFFLRGGYQLFCYLNLSSGLSMRGRLFGGLNHAKRPAQRLADWFYRFVDEARARAALNVDVFVAEEINSGSAAHRVMNVIHDALSGVNPQGVPVFVDFWFYLACTDESVFDVSRFKTEIQSKRKIDRNGITVRNNFRLFQGPLITYDQERYSGLQVVSQGSDSVEAYKSIRHRPSTFRLECPDTGLEQIWCAPGENDLSNFAGVLVLNLLGFGGPISHEVLARRLATQPCIECQHLFGQLRSAAQLWGDVLL